MVAPTGVKPCYSAVYFGQRRAGSEKPPMRANTSSLRWLLRTANGSLESLWLTSAWLYERPFGCELLTENVAELRREPAAAMTRDE